MQTVYTTTAYPPSVGGAQLHQHLLAQEMSRRGQGVCVVSYWNQNRTDWLRGITLSAPSQPQDYSIDGIPVHLLGFSVGEKLRMLPWLPLYYPLMPVAVEHLSRILEPQLAEYAQQADLIHNVRIGREVLSYASLKLARKLGIPFVLTPVHHPRWQGWRYRVYEEIYRQADAVVALTEAERQTLVQIGVAAKRIFVTGIGPVLASQANPETFRNNHQIGGPIVLFLGQHYPYKGYQQLLRATAQVWQSFPDTHFVFLGPLLPGARKFFRYFRDPRIRCLGAVSLQEKTDALAACDLLCVPSVQESFGGVYTEAWSFGKPVIGCPIPAVAEVIHHGVDGLLVSQDPQAIARGIVLLLQDAFLARKMGESGHNKVKNQYSWPLLAEKTLSVYQQVTDYG